MQPIRPYLGVTVTHGDGDQLIVHIYDTKRPDHPDSYKVVPLERAADLVAAVVRTHDPRLDACRDELTNTIRIQLTSLINDPNLRAAQWLPSPVPS